MKLYIIAFTRRGVELAWRIRRGLAGEACELFSPQPYAHYLCTLPFDRLDRWTAEAFSKADGLIFVGACGIAVRAVAPFLRDKYTDPAVVAVDEGGAWCVPLVSGHVGGANALARRLAGLIGAQAAVTTATDVNGLFAVDEWAARRGLVLDGRAAAKRLSAALLAGEGVGFATDFPVDGPLPEGVAAAPAPVGFAVTLNRAAAPFPETLRIYPKILRIGIGCRRGAAAETLSAAVERLFEARSLPLQAVERVCTIDLKGEEPGILALCRARGWPLACYTAEELRSVPGDFTPSDFVARVTGVDNVCERAAVMGGGKLLVKKQAGEGVTVAVATGPFRISFEEDGKWA